jgi:putative tricarboxylic transport membrane protein
VKRGWIVASLVFLGLFGFAIWQSLLLPLIDELGPGPGFFPLALAGLGGVLSLVLVAQTMREPEGPGGEALMPDREALSRILAIVVVLAGAAFLLDWLGWRMTAVLVTAILLPALGARSPISIIAVSLAAGFGVFHVFYYWLKVPLPVGALEEQLYKLIGI